MTPTPIEIAGLTLAVIAGLLAWWTHYEWLAVWWWPLVGSEWRAERRRMYGPPGMPCECPNLAGDCDGNHGPDEAWQEMVALGQELEPLDRDEWEQLDPDTAAATLIAEWHDEGNETTAITGQINVLDDLRLLAWDASRQVSMIKTIRAAYRQEMAWTLDWYRDALEQRRAA